MRIPNSRIAENNITFVSCFNREVLARFYEKYKQEVVTHFNYEEQVVFPYIASQEHHP